MLQVVLLNGLGHIIQMGQSRCCHFDLFLLCHKLRDAEQEYACSIYLFREVEASRSRDYNIAKVEMNRLAMKLLGIRECIYRGDNDPLIEPSEATSQFDRCPRPEWDQ